MTGGNDIEATLTTRPADQERTWQKRVDVSDVLGGALDVGKCHD
jgi:hypothetical protein